MTFKILFSYFPSSTFFIVCIFKSTLQISIAFSRTFLSPITTKSHKFKISFETAVFTIISAPTPAGSPIGIAIFVLIVTSSYNFYNVLNIIFHFM